MLGADFIKHLPQRLLSCPLPVYFRQLLQFPQLRIPASLLYPAPVRLFPPTNDYDAGNLNSS